MSWNSSRHSFGFYIPLLTRKKAAFPRVDYRYSNGNLIAHLYRYYNDIILRIASRGKFGKRSAAFPPDAKNCLCGLFVIPVQSTPEGTNYFKENHPQTLTACGFQPVLPPKNNCSTFATCPGGGFCRPLKLNFQLFLAEATAGTGGGRSRHQHAAAAADSAFCVPHRQASQISEAAWRPTRQGVSAPDFGRQMQDVPAEGDTPPSENPLLTLTLTADQFRHLAFAVYNQVVELTESREAENPEVQDAIRCLNEVSSLCIQLEKRGLS